MKTPSGEKGFAIIALLGLILTLAFFGQSIVYLTGTSSAMRANELDMDRAFYEAHAGLEYGLAKIYAGLSGSVPAPGLTLANGGFVTAEGPTTLTSVGTSGIATVTQQIDKPKQKDCVNLDVSNTNVDDRHLKHVQTHKTCLQVVTIDKITLSWVPDNGERLKKIRIESSTVYDDPLGVPGGTVIDIADYDLSNANTKNFNEINFDSNMSGKTFTMTLTMKDASQTTTQTFTPN